MKKTSAKVFGLVLAFILLFNYAAELIPSASAALPVQESTLTESRAFCLGNCKSIDTVPDGYIGIYTAMELYRVRYDMAANYILMADLDLTDALSVGGELYQQDGWIALGYDITTNTDTFFKGIFDGNGHSISGLTGSGSGVGLFFGIEEGAVLKNLTIASGSFLARNANGTDSSGVRVGCFAHYNRGTIENCHNYADIIIEQNLDSIEKSTFVGGIVGRNNPAVMSKPGVIKGCSNHGNVTSTVTAYKQKYTNNVAGGIAGENLGKVLCCWNNGCVTAKGQRSGKNAAGGIVGQTLTKNYTAAYVDNCYNAGLIHSEGKCEKGSYSGGIIGNFDKYSDDHSMTVRCYNIGEITNDNDHCGALYGFGDRWQSSYDCCYFLNNMRIVCGSYRYQTDADCFLSEAQMRRSSSFFNYDFKTVWSMGGEDYPYPVLNGTPGGNTQHVYQITDAFELWEMRYDLTGEYYLMNDIDLAPYLSEGGDLYTPVGWLSLVYKKEFTLYTNPPSFSGKFHGNGHTISGLIGTGARASLFGTIGKGGTVCDLVIGSGQLGGADCLGSIASENNGTIRNCHNYADVSCDATKNEAIYAGGLVGYNSGNGIISQCTNHGSVSAGGDYNTTYHAHAGGITGRNSGVIEKVWNLGTVHAACKNANESNYVEGSSAGGIAGYMVQNGESFSTDNASIRDAANSGEVSAWNNSGTDCAGGILGIYYPIQSNEAVSRCYNVGMIHSQSSFDGGICGYAYSLGVSLSDCVRSCYFLNAGQNRAIGNDAANTCVPLTELQMREQASFEGFDFDAVWAMGFADYPYPVFTHGHLLTRIEAVAPTCTVDGNIECWRCAVCEQLFEDEACGQAVSHADCVLPALGHNYVNGKCSRCGKWDPAANPFVDVAEDKFYYDSVLWAFYNYPQITNGTDGTHFSPNKTCTRGQVVTFLWRAYGCPEPTVTTHPFTDVKSGAYYFTAMLWAVEQGITSGTSATTFGPNKDCTRGQVVTFLWRAAGQPEPETTDCPFTDVKSTASYYKAVLWAVETGVTSGTSATTFSPSKSCNRGQVVTFLHRAVTD